MLLVGRDLSPFVRRTATVMELLKLRYERCKIATMNGPDEAAEFNPLGRVPALRLSDDEILVDSTAIIDHLLEIGDAQHKLLPATGPARRAVLHNSAIATGVMEKGVAASYELRRRPKHLIHEPWLAQMHQQVLSGLTYLDQSIAGKHWFSGQTPRLDDVNAVVAFDFITLAHPGVISPDLQGLAALSLRANDLAAFRNTRWQPD
ncbi:MAG: glutathione S-transferase family protein [Chromatiales bacterium]|jgi:glutathione S-transferase|nr:glutathione S-transferase family protein [Chromatiales bacterium]